MTERRNRLIDEEPKQIRLIAFYLPQFHPIPENDEWWGKDFTEWTNVSKATPQFPGHNQPRIPADLGFYDLCLPEVRKAQADLAKRHGIDGFCYWHYWFNGKRLLEKPFNEILETGEPDFPFCLAWANETWSRRWLGEEKDILIKQTYSAEDDINHIKWLVTAFSDSRYIKVDGRPLFLIYRPKDLPDPQETTDVFRNECIKNGLPEPYLVGIDAHCPNLDCRTFGFDSTLHFMPQLGNLPDFLNDEPSESKKLRNLKFGINNSKLKLYDYAEALDSMLSNRKKFLHPVIPSIFVGWDNTPRRGENAIILLNSTPEKFSTALKDLIDSVKNRPPQERLVFINAWNEWAEGNYLEPDSRYGLKYLEEVKQICDEFQEKENVKVSRKVRAIAFYLPQFYPIPENDEWWGKDFTDWVNVAKATPQFPGHYQPRIPADLGYYDLRLPEIREAQVNLAREYGIYGFCYYHYWFNGKLLLETPLHEVLNSGEPDFPFCICWANEDWTRAWDGRSGEILIQQDYTEDDDLEHIKYLCKFFHDKRYIRINGKPLFLVYRASKIPNPRKTTAIWREEARKLGVGELYLCRVESFPAEHTDPTVIGFDAAVEFQPDWTELGDKLSDSIYGDHEVFIYEQIVERMLKKIKPPYKRFPCITPTWDNSPRRKSNAYILIDSSPQIYERWLKETLRNFEVYSPEENFIFINAWNEWGESNYLEPDLKFGKMYLEATKNALLDSTSKLDDKKTEEELNMPLPIAIQDNFSIIKVASYESYNKYISKMHFEYIQREQYERSLIKDSKPFTVEGYCYVCDQKVDFSVDYEYSSEVNGVLTPNWRERLVCPVCGLNNRMRASIHLFEQVLKTDRKGSKVYITEQVSPVYNWLKKNYADVVGSEYLGDSVLFGTTNSKGIRNEKLTKLSFSDNQFDYILSFDIFEHVPNFKKAFQECFRVLKPNGALFFTVPFAANSEKNIIRAIVKENGDIEHLVPPDIHGSPVNPKGCLAYYYFGWEMLEQLKVAGFDGASAYFYWSKEFGYLGGEQIVFIAEK
jgi:lipopolysaccharide biosynthesis protein/SAM-dependent methyltransferase